MEEREKEKQREMEREKLEHEKLRLEMEEQEREKERERQDRIEIEKEKFEFQLKIKELELQDKIKPKTLPLDTSKNFDVTKHIGLVPPFQEREVDKFFLHFEKVAENLKWPKEKWTLQSVLIGKACEFTLSFHLSKAQIMTKLKNLFLRVMSWSLRLTGRNLEIAEKNMTRLMLNSLEQKSNYLIGGALQRKMVLIMQN